MTSLIPVGRGKETFHMTILSQLKASWLEYLNIFTTYMKPYKRYSVTRNNKASCFKMHCRIILISQMLIPTPDELFQLLWRLLIACF